MPLLLVPLFFVPLLLPLCLLVGLLDGLLYNLVLRCLGLGGLGLARGHGIGIGFGLGHGLEARWARRALDRPVSCVRKVVTARVVDGTNIGRVVG